MILSLIKSSFIFFIKMLDLNKVFMIFKKMYVVICTELNPFWQYLGTACCGEVSKGRVNIF